MIKSKNLTVKNFMSVGNAIQGIDFDCQDLTLIKSEFYNNQLLLKICQNL